MNLELNKIDDFPGPGTYEITESFVGMPNYLLKNNNKVNNSKIAVSVLKELDEQLMNWVVILKFS